MHFAYSEDQELLRSTTRRFLNDRHPIEAVRARLESADSLDREVWRDGAALGWTAMLVPEDLDGGSITDQPVVDLAAIAEELGRQLYPGPVLEANVVADVLAAAGDDEQRKRLLGPIARGELIPTWCLSGDGTPNIDAIAVVATATSRGVRLDGVARFVPAAPAADLLLVACASGGGPSLALVRPSAEGVTTRVHAGIDLTRRDGEVRLDGVVVAPTDLVGGQGGAAPHLERALRLATVVQAAEAVGAAERLFEATVQYAKDRVQFGRAIGSFQAIKHRLADVFIEIEGARAAARYAALAVADDRPDRDEAVAVAGSTVRDAVAHAAGESLQLHGGIGFTWDHDVHLFLRRAKAEQARYGEPWWHRERLCRLVEANVAEGA